MILPNPLSLTKNRGFALINRLVRSKSSGFTLIELLVVIAIIGIILSLGLAGFQRAQVNARDSRREKDLSQIMIALEIHFDNNLFYPPSKNGAVFCPNQMGTGRTISWGGFQPFSCDGEVYMRTMPKDPTATTTNFYCYRATEDPAPSSTFFELWAIMENPKNKNTTDPPPIGSECIGSGYNYKLENEK